MKIAKIKQLFFKQFFPRLKSRIQRAKKKNPVINIILKLTILMIKGEKKSNGVARSKFFERIKETSQIENHKQNLNLNDIRESGYKLPRSKSGSRYDHSLQRKTPIKIKENQIGLQKNNENSSKILIKEHLADTPGMGVTTMLKQAEGGRQFIYSQNRDNYDSNSKKRGTSKLNLQQQEQSLYYIRSMWDDMSKMKQKGFFIQQMLQIEAILKNIILDIAKPKFNSMQEGSTLSLKFPQSKCSPHMNLQSYKESSNPSKQNSISHFQSRSTKRNKQSNTKRDHRENQQDQELQFKKIMYILEQKSKNTKNQEYFRKDSQYELRQITNTVHKKPLSYESSFNCSEIQQTGRTVKQFEKINKSFSNDKIFLKNIVKKSKNSGSDGFSEKQKHELSKGQNLHEQLSITNIAIEQQQYSYSLDDTPQSQKCSIPQTPTNPQDIIKMDTLQTLQDQSESKRAVLNQIISMLNKKYNKNIQLQPRSF